MEPVITDLAEDPRARVAHLKKIATAIRKQLKAERAGGLPTEASLQAALDEAEDRVEQLEARIAKAKGLSKKRKREIDEWKTWYNNQPDIDKTAARAKLDGEIHWRADEIKKLEDQISRRIAKHLDAEGAVEQVRHQMAALEAGVYDRPIKEDPRLIGVLEELEEAKAALPKVKKPSKKRKKRRKSAK